MIRCGGTAFACIDKELRNILNSCRGFLKNNNKQAEAESPSFKSPMMRLRSTGVAEAWS